MSFAGAFTEEQRQESFRRQFRPGVVIKLYCEFTEPPKEKRLLVVSITPEPLLFVINSEINDFKRKRQDLYVQQVCLHNGEHGFLEHDSYVDCSRVRDDFSAAEIQRIVTSDLQRRLLGRISESAAAAIMEVVNESPTLERRHINRILSDLI